MANEEHVAILNQGVAAWNRWREKQHRRLVVDLSHTDFSNVNLPSANFEKACLIGAFFNNANLTSSDFNGALLHMTSLSNACLENASINSAHFHESSLAGANLKNANLTNSSIRETSLVDANLEGAKLGGVHFCDTDLRGTNFARAVISVTVFSRTDLAAARGLAEVVHSGPSTLGVDTLYLSKGMIPERFLRGCGVPENLVRYIPSLLNSEDGIQFYSCFISYSTKDKEFADWLHGRMHQAHLRVWYAPQDIQGGKKVHEQIDTAIRVYDKLLIVLSAASLKSEWVMTELRKARKAERLSGKRKLFPVRLVDFDTLRDWECFDADSGKDLAVELREYFIPDFSNWKDHDQFEAAFSRLLKDLRAEERAK